MRWGRSTDCAKSAGTSYHERETDDDVLNSTGRSGRTGCNACGNFVEQGTVDSWKFEGDGNLIRPDCQIHQNYGYS